MAAVVSIFCASACCWRVDLHRLRSAGVLTMRPSTLARTAVRAIYLSDLDAHLCFHDLPGQTPVRLYLGGLGATGSAYAHIATRGALAGHRSLLVDLLGSGHSDRPDDFGYTLGEQAATIGEMLDELKIERCQ